MDWNEIAEKITPHVVKIETPDGHGTGFLCLHNADKSFVGIATAHHVIDRAHSWFQPIRLTQYPSGKSVVLQPGKSRTIWVSPGSDSAMLFMHKGNFAGLDLPDTVIPLLPTGQRLPIGVEVGWLGYPALGSSSNTVCFFTGTVSAWQEPQQAYLIDGVAINGCSGGPVVCASKTDGVQIVGAVSAYIVNRSTGESLPGLAVAQDVSFFLATASHVKSVDDAIAQQEKQELEKRLAQTSTTPTVSTLDVETGVGESSLSSSKASS